MGILYSSDCANIIKEDLLNELQIIKLYLIYLLKKGRDIRGMSAIIEILL